MIEQCKCGGDRGVGEVREEKERRKRRKLRMFVRMIEVIGIPSSLRIY